MYKMLMRMEDRVRQGNGDPGGGGESSNTIFRSNVGESALR